MKTDDVEEDDVRDDDIVTTMMTINCGPRQIVTALPTTHLPLSRLQRDLNAMFKMLATG